MKDTFQMDRVTLVGHPLATIGRGEDLRCAARALNAVGIPFSIFDLDRGVGSGDQALQDEFSSHFTHEFSPFANLFFINGDEVGGVLARFPGWKDSRAVQIIIPQWELPNYPLDWVEEIGLFDEIWAPSFFVKGTLEKGASTPVLCIPLPVEIRLKFILPRRYFGLRESAFTFLFFFDFSAYSTRKNPQGALKVFEMLCDQLESEDLELVIKTNAPWEDARFRKEEQELMEKINGSRHRDRITLINRTLTDNQVKNLIRCCDCFLSLHRSEGFGRGMAEAMALGKPVIGTGYSGNLDFMDGKTAHLVEYDLIKVQSGEYPYGEGQVWADPNLEDALESMIRVVQDRESALLLGRAGSLRIRTYFSYRAVGLQYSDRLEEILRS